MGVCALVIAAALLSACTLKPDQRESAGSTRTAEPQAVTAAALRARIRADQFNDRATGKEAPNEGGQLVIEADAEPNSLNPFTDNSEAAAEIGGYIYDSLLRRNPETLQWEPSLAKRWTVEDIVVRKDGTELRGISSEPSGQTGPVLIKTSSGTIRLPRAQVREIHKGVVFTFYLRKDVHFHDGAPFTAADVKFTFDTLKDEWVDAPALQSYYKDMESCQVLDNYTVRMTYSKQYWQAIDYAGGLMVFPRHIYDADNLLERDPKAFGQRFNDSPYNRTPIGTGPYEFERWETGSDIILKRNPHYFDPAHRGHLDRIVYKFVSDSVAALQALKNGEINFLPRITAEQFEKETSSPGFHRKFAKAEYYTGSMTYICWNMRRPPFNDPKVRLAMAYGALNVPEFLQKVRYGHGVVVTGVASFFGPDYDHSIQPYPFDPDKAKELLLEAGWYDRNGDGIRDKNGMPFRFELLFPSGSSIGSRLGALMKENLRKLGIEVEIRQLEFATFLQNLSDHKFDAYVGAWSTDVDYDPYQLWHTSQSKNGGSNYPGWGNAGTDRMIEQSRVTLDPVARRKLLFKLQRIQYREQPYLFLYDPSQLGVYDKRYRGVKLYDVGPGFDLTEWFLPGAGPSAAPIEHRKRTP